MTRTAHTGHVCPACGSFDPDTCPVCDDYLAETTDTRPADRGQIDWLPIVAVCIFGAALLVLGSLMPPGPYATGDKIATTATTTPTPATRTPAGSTTTLQLPASDAEQVAVVATPATRSTQQQVAATTQPPATIPATVAGDCASWAELFAARGATPDQLAFFIGDGILWRETRCGTDLLNDATGDSGICQINPVHNRPGWFGGREFGPGGWLLALHGRTTRLELDHVGWVDACLTLHRVCGERPWQLGSWGCEGNRL